MLARVEATLTVLRWPSAYLIEYRLVYFGKWEDQRREYVLVLRVNNHECRVFDSGLGGAHADELEEGLCGHFWEWVEG